MKRLIKILVLIIILSHFSIVKAIDISSPSAIVISRDSGRILYDKNGHEQRKMASLTKIMTSILLVENCKMDEKIQVDKRACYIGGSEAGIKPNDILTAETLLYGMLLPSGNDCALETAYHIGGNVENFAKLMNSKVQELGLENTHFDNPHGLDSDTHYSTAYSLALLMRYALSYNSIEKAVNTTSYTANFGSFTKTLNNTNSLLRTYNKATGGKTGFTNGANRCLICSAKDNDFEIIGVVLGSDTSKMRFNDTETILEYVFNNYKLYDLSNFLNIYINIPVEKGTIKSYTWNYTDTKKEALTEEEYSKIYVDANFITKISAPMKKGDYIGTYTVKIDDEVLYKKDICLEEDIEKKSPFDYFKSSIKDMFCKLELI